VTDLLLTADDCRTMIAELSGIVARHTLREVTAGACEHHRLVIAGASTAPHIREDDVLARMARELVGACGECCGRVVEIGLGRERLAE
jgi:hypothetical protein